MKLPINLPFLEKKSAVEYFLVLLLRDEKANALIVEQNEGRITIIGKHEEYFQTTLEEAGDETLVEVLDRTISRAEEMLPPSIEVQNTVFGVKDTWVEEKKIKKEHLAKLKKVCDQLTLVPMGFIVLAEAIAHLIQKEEGAPLSALVTEVGKHSVTISLFRAGKLVETKHTPLDESPVKTVDTLLKEFEMVEILPSRVILFDAGFGTDEDSHAALAQKFIAHQWSKHLPFLHVPQISILPAEFDGKAIVAGAAEQLGFEMTGISVDAKHIDIKTYDKHHLVNPEKVVEKERMDEEKLEEKEPLSHETKQKKDTDDEDIEVIPQGDNFGFVVDQDIATIPQTAKHISEHTKEKSHEERPHKPSHHAEHATVPQKSHPVTEEQNDDEILEEGEELEAVEPTHRKPALGGLVPALLAPLKTFSNIRPPRHPGGNKILIIPPLVLIILIGAILLYLFQIKATVMLVVAPKMVDETQKVTFSTTSGNDFSQNLLAAKEVSVTLDGTATTTATGEKETGEKAKGTVTIYNSGDTKRTLKEGTSITSSNGMVFTLDKELSIASASGDIFSGIKSGTAQAAVTAKNIGSEYNMPSNTKFSVEGSSELAAKNDGAFSGGSKKKITVIAKKDVDKVTEELPKSLEEEAKKALAEKVGDTEQLLPTFTTISFEKKELSKDVGDESKDIKLTATIKFSTISYADDDVTQFAQTALKNRYAQDQTIAEKDIKTRVTGLKEKSDSEITGVLEIEAGLLPKLDNPKIAREVTGKSFDEVQVYIKRLPQVDRAEIALSPNIPFLPKYLPRMSENITVVIKPNE